MRMTLGNTCGICSVNAAWPIWSLKINHNLTINLAMAALSAGIGIGIGYLIGLITLITVRHNK